MSKFTGGCDIAVKVMFMLESKPLRWNFMWLFVFSIFVMLYGVVFRLRGAFYATPRSPEGVEG